MEHMNASMVVASWIKDGMPGLWLGVTAENQEQAEKRIPILLQIPSKIKFVSVEPMIESIDLSFHAQFEHEDNEGYGVEALTLPQMNQWDSQVIKSKSVSGIEVRPQVKAMPLALLDQSI
jgi:hypothetical protein